MEWSTHALSGVLAGYIVTNDWKGAIVGGVAGIIPDLDEHKSKFGKMLFPISYPINKIFGHRTFTHSILFILIIGIVLFLFTEKWVWLATVTGILAHIVGDMLTGKVKFFYPLKKSIGFRIQPIYFKIIDRVTRAILIVALFFVFLDIIPDVS